MTEFLSCSKITVVKFRKLIILESDLFSEGLSDEEYIWIGEVIAVVKEYSLELIDWVIGVDVDSSFIDYFIDFDWLCAFGCNFSFGVAVHDLKIEVGQVFFSNSVLHFEEAGSIEYYFFLAKGDEKADLF